MHLLFDLFKHIIDSCFFGAGKLFCTRILKIDRNHICRTGLWENDQYSMYASVHSDHPFFDLKQKYIVTDLSIN